MNFSHLMVSKITIFFKLADIGTVAHWFFAQNKIKNNSLSINFQSCFTHKIYRLESNVP